MSLKDAVELAVSYSRPCEECAELRAQAEALAGALQAIARRVPALGPGDDYRDGQWTALAACAEVARAALARLPAQALAERQALERCAAVLSRVLEPDDDPLPAQREARNALGALDAVRQA